ncbi:rhodanese-like domain-containing protein [Streptococcus respiraculi]|uniref:rhodanese-like domain-containing protein n=1 Tax=Streptococcus respiraculi TaxID=2021971 RepID=UPI000E74DBF4|nr:rhodanese-like domain-containing protein [Streptococcus respiraculi]
MRKTSIVLVILISIVAFFAYRHGEKATKPEETSRVGQWPIGRVEIGIKWSEASKDAQKYQIRFEQVLEAVKNGAKCYDVRSFIEYQLGHVEIAEHYPLATLGKQEFPALVHDVPIYLYGSDNGSSAQAAKLLRDEGFHYVYDLGSVDQIKAIGATVQGWWSSVG